jgi:hypothetical protein
MRDISVIEELPEIVQTDLARDTVSYTFKNGVDVYDIKKGPATRVFTVRSAGQPYVEGTDFELIEDSDGNYISIDWSIGGSSPNAGQKFTIDQEYRSVLSRYVEAHDEEFESLNEDIITIISNRQVVNAEGEELDRIGAIFGQLGKRSGRNDSDYRAYLRSIVDSFGGRGSRAGLRFAIASAVGTTPDNIEIRENVSELSYTILINNVDTEFISTSIDELADLADPSGVELEEAIIITDGIDIEIVGGSSSIDTQSTGLGGGTLTLDGNSTLG